MSPTVLITVTKGRRVSFFLVCFPRFRFLSHMLVSVAGKSFCGHIADYLVDVGYVPDARAQDFCVVFDKDVYEGRTLSVESEESVVNFCGVSTIAWILFCIYASNSLQDICNCTKKQITHNRCCRIETGLFGIPSYKIKS